MAKKHKKRTAQKQARVPNNKHSVLVAVAWVGGLVAVLALCLWLFRPGPLDKVRSAAKKTFLAENFTAKFDIDLNGQKSDGTIKATIDPDTRKLELYMQLTTNVSDYECGIYDNSFVVCTAATGDISSVDITQRVDNFFLLLEKTGQPDWSVLLDLEELDLHETITKDFDLDVFLSCLGQWLNKLNSTGWAEKNAGFSKETQDGVTTYRFTPDLHTLALETAPLFQKAFLEPKRYQDLLTYLDDAKYLFKDGNADLSLTVADGHLDSAVFDLKYHNTALSGNVRFSDIGTTQIDTNTLASYVQQGFE